MQGVSLLFGLEASIFHEKCVYFLVCGAINPVNGTFCDTFIYYFFGQIHSLHQGFLFNPLVILENVPLVNFDKLDGRNIFLTLKILQNDMSFLT